MVFSPQVLEFSQFYLTLSTDSENQRPRRHLQLGKSGGTPQRHFRCKKWCQKTMVSWEKFIMSILEARILDPTLDLNPIFITMYHGEEMNFEILYKLDFV